MGEVHWTLAQSRESNIQRACFFKYPVSGGSVSDFLMRHDVMVFPFSVCSVSLFSYDLYIKAMLFVSVSKHMFIGLEWSDSTDDNIYILNVLLRLLARLLWIGMDIRP
jgi:hypothetical protein